MPDIDAATRTADNDRPVAQVARSNDVEAKPVRRPPGGRVAVARLAKLIGAREELCVVHDLSSAELKAEVFSPKAVGEPLAVDFGGDLRQAARVSWAGDGCVGLTFDRTIDVDQALAPIPGDRRARRLRLCLPVALDARIRAKRRKEDGQLIDISQHGAKVRTRAAFKAGARVRLEVDGLGAIAGAARWLRDGNLGISFAVPLPYRLLASWIAGQAGTGDKCRSVARAGTRGIAIRGPSQRRWRSPA